MKQIIEDYLKYLEDANYSKLMSLFSDDAIIYSPLYGEQKAAGFYKTLLEDTQRSKLRLLGVYTNEYGKSAVANFYFDWILKDGTLAPFEVVDIFQFNNDLSKIDSVKIIYDTWNIRNDFLKLKETKLEERL